MNALKIAALRQTINNQIDEADGYGPVNITLWQEELEFMNEAFEKANAFESAASEMICFIYKRLNEGLIPNDALIEEIIERYIFEKDEDI